jgi:NitT/TauT family transport system substrate-binding protein
MKKILGFSLLILFSLLLTGCRGKTPVLTVMAPAGSPALSQLYIQQDSEHYRVDIVNGSDPLIAAFGSGSHDIIFAPTNLGAKLYNTGTGYRFAGTVVWGNYYLVAKGRDTFDLASLEGKTIVVFGQNSTSDIIVKYLLAENGITAILTYVDAVSTATAQFIGDESLIILTAEPSLSVLAARIPDLQVIDLQTEYETITGTDSYPQAGVFVKDSLATDLVIGFLSDLADSVDLVNANPEKAENLAISLEYGFSEGVLLSAIPNSHMAFVDAAGSKPALETYFTMILEYNGALVGNRLPDEDFYFLP